MSTEDEVRALKRELASGAVRGDQERQNAILAELALRGEKSNTAPGVEKRGPGRPKKTN